MPMFRNLWEHIRTKMPKKGRGKGGKLDPLSLPPQLQTALEALYGHYDKTYALWEKAGIRVPPCFIVVCNNTSTSKLVYDFISGFQKQNPDGSTTIHYIDPPYGIKFNSNFQWSTTSRDVKDGNVGHITREPEQVKAFRDTWRDGIHSYLTYLRDRLTVARDLLHDSGSIFVQIGDENVHRVRALMDEVFGENNFIADIVCLKTTGQSSEHVAGVFDYILYYGRNKELTKSRQLYRDKVLGEKGTTQYVWIRD